MYVIAKLLTFSLFHFYCIGSRYVACQFCVTWRPSNNHHIVLTVFDMSILWNPLLHTTSYIFMYRFYMLWPGDQVFSLYTCMHMVLILTLIIRYTPLFDRESNKKKHKWKGSNDNFTEYYVDLDSLIYDV
jgi:hypothetical protein